MATFSDLEAWCSPHRLARFLLDADGDEELAVRLYEWNADLSGGFMEVIHHVEVVLRNHLDATLTARFPGPDPWYLNGAVLTPQGRAKADEAVARIQAEGKQPSHGRVIAGLGFGFWDAMFGRRYDQLWLDVLAQSFPHGPSRRRTAAGVTSRVRLFRNRLAHHERIIHLDLTEHHADLLTLVAWIDTRARRWVADESPVPVLLNARPHH